MQGVYIYELLKNKIIYYENAKRKSISLRTHGTIHFIKIMNMYMLLAHHYWQI